jgi:hypothetical protein
MVSGLKLATGSLCCLLLAASAVADDAGLAYFESRIRPVLAEHCYSCHSATAPEPKAGLRLDSRHAALQGGERGPALLPGEPEESLLIRAIAYSDPDLQMPPRTRLQPQVVEDFQHWIKLGAPWPDSSAHGSSRGSHADRFDLQQRRDDHWAWQPVRRPAPERITTTGWSRNPIDDFVRSHLEHLGLQPAADADRRTLIRRASLILTGLPPSPDEVDAFVGDLEIGAFEDLVNRLLASPAFGERWARLWLDKMRYAETLGHEFDYSILGAWQYRDYVVRAFNTDLPYDRFVTEQIAGDLLPRRRISSTGIDEAMVATAQFWLSQQVHSPVDVRQHQAEFIDNQIDVVSKAFLGLTVSCARCHDHKFDAISTRDYYALFGIFSSSRFGIRPIDDSTSRRTQAGQLRQLRDQWRHDLAAQLHDYLNVSSPGPALPTALPRLRAVDRVLSPQECFPDGEGFAFDTCPTGQPVAAVPARVHLVLPDWHHSASLSSRFQGALRSATFPIEEDFLHLRVAGRGSRFSVVLEGFTLVRAPIYGALRQQIHNPAPHWITLDLSMWKGRRAWIEFADFSVPDPASTLPPDAAALDGSPRLCPSRRRWPATPHPRILILSSTAGLLPQRAFPQRNSHGSTRSSGMQTRKSHAPSTMPGASWKARSNLPFSAGSWSMAPDSTNPSSYAETREPPVRWFRAASSKPFAMDRLRRASPMAADAAPSRKPSSARKTRSSVV